LPRVALGKVFFSKDRVMYARTYARNIRARDMWCTHERQGDASIGHAPEP
jgi:hypothetical protein